MEQLLSQIDDYRYESLKKCDCGKMRVIIELLITGQIEANDMGRFDEFLDTSIGSSLQEFIDNLKEVSRTNGNNL